MAIIKEKYPKVHTGWRKQQSAKIRRALALKAHKGDPLAAARALQRLTNVTKDKETAVAAGEDADYLFSLHNETYRSGNIVIREVPGSSSKKKNPGARTYKPRRHGRDLGGGVIKEGRRQHIPLE